MGQQIGGRYQIIKALGSGSFGQTFLAKDTHDNEISDCVVKQLKCDNEDNLKTARRLFDTEAKILEKLGSHSQIPQLFNYFEEAKEFYLVQEFIDGQDLDNELKPGIKYSESDVKKLLIDILEILTYVHDNNVIHSDIKPGNIMRRKSGELVLIDFGAVKQVGTIISQKNGTVAKTVTIGTPGYMPSEQAIGKPRFSSDIYAVGMIAIQALTGLLPEVLQKEYENQETEEIDWRKLADVSDRLGNILDRMIRYDYRQLYPSAVEVLEVIKSNEYVYHPTQLIQNQPDLPEYKPAKTLRQSDYESESKPKKSWLNRLLKPLDVFKAIDLYNQGFKLADLGKYEEAIASYDQAIELNPKCHEAWCGRGNMLGHLGRDEEMILSYDKALEIEPDDYYLWNVRGNVLKRLSRNEEAINSYEKAIEIKENYGNAWLNLGNLLENLGRYEKAIGVYDLSLILI